jgi:hypothetical protein
MKNLTGLGAILTVVPSLGSTAITQRADATTTGEFSFSAGEFPSSLGIGTLATSGVTFGVQPTANARILADSGSDCSSPGWQRGHLDEQGSFTMGTPNWGQFTSTGISFSNDALTSQQLVCRWQSNFNGQVNLMLDQEILNQYNINAKILVNGLSPMGISADSNASITSQLSSLKLMTGDKIDLVFSPKVEQWQGSFPSTNSSGSSLALLGGLAASFIPGNVPTLQQQPSVNFSAQVGVPSGLVFVTRQNYLYSGILGSGVSVRSGPGYHYSIIGELRHGSTVLIDSIKENAIPGECTYPPAPDWSRKDIFPEPFWYRLAGTNQWFDAHRFNSTNSEQTCYGCGADLVDLVDLKAISALKPHVGLLGTDGRVYESYAGYSTGVYPDILNNTLHQNSENLIEFQIGTQDQHSLGSFIYDGTDRYSEDYLHVDIPDRYAAEITNRIAARLGSGYFDNQSCLSITTTTSTQPVNCTNLSEKGQGGSYSPVGLIEAASEEAGLNGGQGFIPNQHESQGFNRIIGFQGTSIVKLASPQSIAGSLLTPDYLQYFATKGLDVSDHALKGWLKSVYFILTAPSGAQLGYTTDQGLFNNIAGSFFSSSYQPSPIDGDIPDGLAGYPSTSVPPLSQSLDPICSGSGSPTPVPPPPEDLANRVFQLLVPKPESGRYQLTLFGYNRDSTVVIGNSDQGTKVSHGVCDPNPPINSQEPGNPGDSDNSGNPDMTGSPRLTPPETLIPDPGGVDIRVIPNPSPSNQAGVPEPSSVLGLLASGGLMGWLRSRKRKKA